MIARLIYAARHPFKAITTLIRRLFFIKHLVKLQSVKSYLTTSDYKCIATGNMIAIRQPIVFGETKAQHYADVSCQLSESYVARLRNIVAISRSTLIKTGKNSAVYDELALLKDRKRYGLRFSGISLNSSGESAAFTTWYRSHSINKGIHLMHEASHNYFHWLIECLPRLSLIDNFTEYDSWPIIIDDGLPNQFIEALRIFDRKNRHIIPIPPLRRVSIRELAFGTCQSVFRDNYNNKIDPSHDIMISPSDVQILRDRICSVVAPDIGGPKKIYISRRGASYRNILNENVVESFLIDQGFTIINPGALSFKQQVSLLSQAQIVVGPTGAGLTNMVFAPAGCKVLCLINNNEQSNLYFFNFIAQALGLQFAHVIGQEHSILDFYKAHNDYTVDIDILEQALSDN